MLFTKFKLLKEDLRVDAYCLLSFCLVQLASAQFWRKEGTHLLSLQPSGSSYSVEILQFLEDFSLNVKDSDLLFCELSRLSYFLSSSLHNRAAAEIVWSSSKK